MCDQLLCFVFGDRKKGWKCKIQFYRTHLSGLITYSLNYERNKEIRNNGRTKVLMVKCKLRDNRLLISSVDRNPISISSSLDLDWHIPFLGSLFPENIQKCFRIILLYYHNKIQNTFCHSDIIPFVFFWWEIGREGLADARLWVENKTRPGWAVKGKIIPIPCNFTIKLISCPRKNNILLSRAASPLWDLYNQIKDSRKIEISNIFQGMLYFSSVLR